MLLRMFARGALVVLGMVGVGCSCPPSDPTAVVAKTTEFRLELGKVDLVSPDTRFIPVPVYLLVRQDGTTFEVTPTEWAAAPVAIEN
jgi:hypothetical protein